MAILALVATVAVITTNTEIKISSNYKTSIQASYAAQAGYEEARARLRGLTFDDNYAGDPASSDPTWSAYILTSDTWEFSTDPNDSNYLDPNYKNYIPLYDNPVNHTNTATETNTIQATPDISYWVKIRHKREADMLNEPYTDYGGATNDIIYYGYAATGTSTVEQFTTDDDPFTASPVEIITSYGSSGTSLSVIEIQARRFPGPPIVGTIYAGNDIYVESGTIITGNDYVGCAADPVPAITYVYNKSISPGVTLESEAGTSTTRTSLDLTTVDELESIKTVTLTGNQTDYNVGSNSNYEVVYCDATQLSDDKITLTNISGYGTLVVSGKIEFKGTSNWWYGLIIASEKIEFDGDGTVYGAVLSGGDVYIPGTWEIDYDSCEIDKAKSSFPYATFRWEDKKLN
jgi:hypothetical protein